MSVWAAISSFITSGPICGLMPTIALAPLGGALIATASVKVHRHKRKYGGVYRREGPRVRVALRI